MKYIGIDVHAKTLSINLQDQDGTELWAQTCPTSGKELVKRITALSGPKTVIIEEGTLADWVFRLLSPYAEVIVADPRQNRHIAGDEMINDAISARKLAQLFRAGSIKPVHHSESDERQEFKELVQAYHDLTKQLTRCKNQVKAKFRARAISCSGDSVFNANPDNRAKWLAKLKSKGAQAYVQLVWERLDLMEAQRERLLCDIRQLAKQFPQIARFMQIPGIGLVRAVTFFAFLDTPQRFRTKGKLWGYCGIGIAKPSSGQSSGPEHLNRFGNRTLKSVLKGAALRAIQAGDNPFADKYRRQIAEGIAPELARLSVARSIASTMWAMWRKDEDYQPDRASPWDNLG
jgi:transposase